MLAATLSGCLSRRFGSKKFYTAEEVETVCNECNVPADTREYAVAMFVEPEQSQGFLQKLGSSRTAIELRKILAQQIFFYYVPGTSFDDAGLDFHAASDAVGAGGGNFNSSDFGGGGGYDGGGSDGGGGGGGD
jgi:hypothetical protein